MRLLPLVLLTTTATAITQECVPFKASHGYTCLCTTEVCDSIAPLNATTLHDTAVIYQTAKETSDKVGDRLRRFELPLLSPAASATTLTTASAPARSITFDPSTTYQTIKGFGNALTDAAALNYERLSNKSLLLEQYWGKTGLGFSVGRVPIASCDFSTSSWSYDDVNNDVELEHFSIVHDEKYKIPLIQVS
jgi:glucosylceramidase